VELVEVLDLVEDEDADDKVLAVVGGGLLKLADVAVEATEADVVGDIVLDRQRPAEV